MNQQKPKSIVCITLDKLEKSKLVSKSVLTGENKEHILLSDLKKIGRVVDQEMIRKVCEAAMITANEQKKNGKSFDGFGFLVQALFSVMANEDMR